jgi:hypothetical protein
VSIQKFTAQFNPTSPLVDSQGIPILGYGRAFFLALFNRTGQGTGIVPIVSDPISATGATIADAFQLENDWNNVTNIPAGTGVAISSALSLQPGNDIWVMNAGAGDLNVYPPDTKTQIDALGAGGPYVLHPGKLRCFQCWASNQFYSYGN